MASISPSTAHRAGLNQLIVIIGAALLNVNLIANSRRLLFNAQRYSDSTLVSATEQDEL